MKAALNGVPSLSVLDGWWIEGCVEGVTGWAVGGRDDNEQATLLHGTALRQKLEQVVVPMYYDRQDEFVAIMRNAISINGSFFHTHRMLQQYVTKAYFC